MITFGVVGIEHPHAMNLIAGLRDAGARCAGFFTGRPNPVLDRCRQRFPDVPVVDDARRLVEDPDVALIVSADVPDLRAAVAVAAMRAGKDVLVAKPGCTTSAQLAEIRAVAARTGRRWVVAFSERLHVRAAVRAGELVHAGAIGTVVQTIGLGPHQLKRSTRPAWFFDPARNGSILTDLASHQIDQFLFYTGSTDAEIVACTVANHATPEHPAFQDFGEVLLRNAHAHGYLRVDWYSPDGLPTWGDGRLTILGTAGYIELRKYVDIAGRPGGDHLFLVDAAGTRHVDCAGVRLPFYPDLVRDLVERTESAIGQEHTFTATGLAVRAAELATR
ncbi:oxidoreductase [Virgisporangium aliadipatigenens]|uniref:Oxidoreductase n=1 Tax=Virgisporangium aliadipatigenens TaxID=741659 RepID=A0A8J3YGP0_9ACTN|nr:Gfo/Idh/MocA family oxidoreductase [Virgisporangium aliadipatigenens]GIJ44924.1 oxidoreductase [Virgisporangium aliadipatigenens]